MAEGFSDRPRFHAMRHAAAILVLSSVSAWAGQQPLTWEPARIARLEEVVASGVLAPTDPHPAFFDFFSDSILESNGSVVFIANSAGRGVSMLGREGVYSIGRDGRASTFIQKGDRLGDGQSPVAAITALELSDGVPVARCVLLDGSKESVALGNVSPNRANSTGDAPRGSTEIRNDGRTISCSGRNSNVRIVADTSTRIAELFAGTFTGFGGRTIGFGPWVIFSGSAKGYEGLFAMNIETNRLYVLLDNRAVIGDRRVEDFQISECPRSAADLAVTVSFADGGSGIYIFRFSDIGGRLLFGS